MKRAPNPKLDPLWEATPTSQRYCINGVRYVEWQGRIVPLAELPDLKEDNQCRST
jgi:hypothetical protein